MAVGVWGLTPDQFYDLTPRQYDLLLTAHYKKQEFAEWQTGIIASAIANWRFGRTEDSPVLKPTDFALPHLRAGMKAERKPRINRQKIAVNVRAQFESAMKAQRALAPKPPRQANA